MSRLLVVCLIAWAAATAPATAQQVAGDGPSSVPSPTPHEIGSAPTPHGASERSSEDDEELIKNLDLIENLDLLDNVEALGAVSTPDTPEEEF